MHKKNLNIMKKVIFFVTHFRKWNHILYRFITHKREIFQASISRNFDDYGLQIIKPQNSVSQKIRILHKINKKGYLNRNVRLLRGMFISMHSICTGWASFCMNYCINVAWRGGNQSVTLLKCNEAQVALIAVFMSSALLV